MQVRVAAVQPHTYRFDNESKNLARAVKYVKEAARLEADIISFPEGYPGPYSGPTNYSCVNTLAKSARENGIFIIAGFAEKANSGNFYITEVLIDGHGDVKGKYRRVQIPPAAVNNVLLNNKNIIEGDVLKITPTRLGGIGLLVCSELYSPELTRVLAVKGADMVFMPVGGMIYELTRTWKTLAWARAIENHIYTIINQNLYGMEEGVAQISGPEEVLGELKGEGILVADLDLQRLDWLRKNEESLDLPKLYKTVPGLLAWRRPELYGPLTKNKNE